MTVYVDQYPGWLGVPKKWEGGGHLFGTNLEELHQFAADIGLRRAWFQTGKSGFPHYDLTRNKRKQALDQGAVSLPEGVIPNDVVRHV